MESIMLSQNGWRVLQAGETRQWIIPDTGRWLRLSQGPAGFVLTHFALWFHKRIEPLDPAPWDDWGWAVRPIRGSSTTMSNHASGTAIDLNATKHPLGVRNTFTLDQASRIRVRLRERYDGCIRWGGDYENRADEMHFEVNVGQARILALADALDFTRGGQRVRLANG
jgi:hypothetical protein